MNQRALGAFARHNDRTGVAARQRLFFGVEPEVSFLFVDAMARVAVLRKKGLNFLLEIDWPRRGRRKFRRVDGGSRSFARQREQQTASDGSEPARPKFCGA
jgi:hypothetical protein